MSNIFVLDGIFPKQYEHEVAGGDMESIGTRKARSAAFKLALKESKKDKYWEVQVKEKDDNEDILNHWYFKKGQLTESMF